MSPPPAPWANGFDAAWRSGLGYSAEFRAEAVRLVREAGRPVTALASELSVHPSTLRRWIRAAEIEASGERSVAPAAVHVIRDESTGDTHVSDAPGVGTLLTESPATLVVARAATEAAPDAAWPRRAVRLAHRRASITVVGLLALSVLLSALLTPSSGVYRAGVILHVLSLVIGFGAVVLVDWHGLLWIAGRRTLYESRRVAESAGPIIWAAIVGLLASGTVLRPQLGSLLTWIKISAILLIVLNGVAVNSLSKELSIQPPERRLRDLSGDVRRRLFASAATSQTGWWIAIAIGLITDMHRRGGFGR